MTAVADWRFPVVPDTGTAKADRLAAERTGHPGHWVRLDCQHIRHVQQPVEDGQLLECPSCPPSAAGVLARRIVGQAWLGNPEEVQGRLVWLVQ